MTSPTTLGLPGTAVRGHRKLVMLHPSSKEVDAEEAELGVVDVVASEVIFQCQHRPKSKLTAKLQPASCAAKKSRFLPSGLVITTVFAPLVVSA
mmetsp:Transcript_15571/g.37012  ORF Transcript_15571/g.37012 Transcript_15571/m.37012 type:complete len:94 (-) Transcript_15571:22-303(-)